jgi:hypothetical protein
VVDTEKSNEEHLVGMYELAYGSFHSFLATAIRIIDGQTTESRGGIEGKGSECTTGRLSHG